MFDELLPCPHNEILLNLLFSLGTFHAYSKLRLHTDTTVQHFRDTTRQLGQIVRRFKRITCSHYETRELPQETAARARRKAALSLRETAIQVGIRPASATTSAGSSGPVVEAPSSKKKHLNLETSKWHELGHRGLDVGELITGHYADSVPRVGPLDNVNTSKVG